MRQIGSSLLPTMLWRLSLTVLFIWHLFIGLVWAFDAFGYHTDKYLLPLSIAGWCVAFLIMSMRWVFGVSCTVSLTSWLPRLITDSWQGRERLWKVFWLYNLLGSNLLFIIMGSLLTAMEHKRVDEVILIPMGVLFATIAFAVFIWLSVSLWRCSSNVKWKGWGVIVCMLVIMGWLGLFVTAFGTLL
jgi:hypothetical protein